MDREWDIISRYYNKAKKSAIRITTKEMKKEIGTYKKTFLHAAMILDI